MQLDTACPFHFRTTTKHINLIKAQAGQDYVVVNKYIYGDNFTVYGDHNHVMGFRVSVYGNNNTVIGAVKGVAGSYNVYRSRCYTVVSGAHNRNQGYAAQILVPRGPHVVLCDDRQFIANAGNSPLPVQRPLPRTNPPVYYISSSNDQLLHRLDIRHLANGDTSISEQVMPMPLSGDILDEDDSVGPPAPHPTPAFLPPNLPDDIVVEKNNTKTPRCCICQDNKPTLCIQSCGHMCLCKTCAIALLNGPSSTHKCPLCKASITQPLLRVFIDGQE